MKLIIKDVSIKKNSKKDTYLFSVDIHLGAWLLQGQ